jgi:prolyl oligopeptidase
MASVHLVATVCRSWNELMWFDIARGCKVSRRIDVNRPVAELRTPLSESEIKAIADAFVIASCLYWKQVRCLQRSLCLARVLRANGVDARMVVGYRSAPFMAHAWVEVNGRVLCEQGTYAASLRKLEVG